MIEFIEAHCAEHGVEPICRALPIAPSTYFQHAAVARTPTKASPRAQRDTKLKEDIGRIWKDNRNVYGARKVWHVLQREGQKVARCTVERKRKSTPTFGCQAA